MQLSVTVSQGETVSTVTAVWYNASGAEISSASMAIGQVITSGQTLTYVYDESMGSSPNPPPGATTCSAIHWS